MQNQNIISIGLGHPPKGGKSRIVEELLNAEALMKHARSPEIAHSDLADQVQPLLIDAALARLEAAFELFDKDPDIGPFEV